MGPQVPPSTAVREALAVGASEPIAYRDVQLTCGVHVLSVAQNWYVPSRLAPAMNEALETSDRPFGSVVAPIRFTRERLSSKRGAAEGCAPDTLLSQRAFERGYFRRDFVKTLFQRHEADDSSYYGDTLWTLLVLEMWHRQAVDEPTAKITA